MTRLLTYVALAMCLGTYVAMRIHATWRFRRNPKAGALRTANRKAA